MGICFCFPVPAGIPGEVWIRQLHCRGARFNVKTIGLAIKSSRFGRPLKLSFCFAVFHEREILNEICILYLLIKRSLNYTS